MVEVVVEALVDAWGDGGARFDGGEVELDFEAGGGVRQMYGWGVGGEGGLPVASDVGAGVGAGDFFFGLEGAGSVSGLGEERAGELGERLGEVGVVGGEEGEEGLLEGAVHGGDGAVC